jgi:hypothetical protein
MLIPHILSPAFVAPLALALALAAGCADAKRPQVLEIVAFDGESQVESLTVAEAEEDAFAEDMPLSVSFDIAFSETIALASAKENVWIEDSAGGKLDVELSARLEVLTVAPVDALGAAENHLLVIQDDLADTSGLELLHGYRIDFYTAADGT